MTDKKDDRIAPKRSSEGRVQQRGVINQDALGPNRVYMQAKSYGPGNNVSGSKVMQFSGRLGMHKATKGLFVPKSSFTPAGISIANNVPNKIVLIDGNRLAELMIDNDLGVSPVATYQMKRIDTDYFTE